MKTVVFTGPIRVTQQDCGCVALEVWNGGEAQGEVLPYAYQVAGSHRPEDCFKK